MKTKMMIMLGIGALTVGVLLAGCGKDSGEQAGKDLDNAKAQTVEAAKKAKDASKKAADEAAKKAKDASKKADGLMDSIKK